MTDPAMVVVIRYTNHRGETDNRRIVPKQIRFISTGWHPREQWILEAYDLDKQADRSFAMADIQAWWPAMRRPHLEES